MRCACFTGLAALLILIAPLGADEKPSKIGTVSGKVTFKDQPLPGGTVAFHPEKGKAVIAALVADGSYSAKVPAGEYRVTIETESLKDKGKEPAKGEEKPKGGDKKEAPKYVKIPEKYGDPTKTPLRVTVTEGEQTVDLKLSD